MRRRKQRPAPIPEKVQQRARAKRRRDVRRREDLDRLRKEFEDGDLLALNEAFLNYRFAQPWIAAALRARLRGELKSKLTKRAGREAMRWFTFLWFRDKGVPPEDAKALAGEICDCDAETVYASYKAFKKKRKIPRRLVLLPRGFEEMTPADLPGGPRIKTLHKLLCDWAVGKGVPREQAEILADGACSNRAVSL